MADEVFPDVEGAMRDLLQADPGILASPASSRSFLALPEKPVFPLITVLRVSGGQAGGEAPMDVALVQIEVRGRVGKLAECEAVRQKLRTCLERLNHIPVKVPGKATLWGCSVLDDRRLPMPEEQDDGSSRKGERPRYVLTAQITATSAA